jgi:hypothetical protein
VTFCRFFDIKKYVYLNCHSCLVLFWNFFYLYVIVQWKSD